MQNKIIKILENNSSLLSNNDFDGNIIYDHDFNKVSLEIRGLILDILDKYNDFLLRENYTDTDIVCEEPTAINQFLNEEI